MIRSLSLSLFILLTSIVAPAQDKLVIDDRANILTEEVEELIKSKLSEQNIEYTTVVDFKARCEYYFTELNAVDEDVFITITDCNSQVLGSKNLGSRIPSTSSQERSFLLSYTMTDIISEPGKSLITQSESTVPSASGQITSFPAISYTRKFGKIY